MINWMLMMNATKRPPPPCASQAASSTASCSGANAWLNTAPYPREKVGFGPLGLDPKWPCKLQFIYTTMYVTLNYAAASLQRLTPRDNNRCGIFLLQATNCLPRTAI